MRSHIRRFILLTLSHAESGDRVHYTPRFVSGKCRSLFNCESVVVAKEQHKSSGYHYHVGILNDTPSCHTGIRVLREAFPEFEGCQLNVSFHKSWNTICAYVLKQDDDPFCWGTTKQKIKERLSSVKKRKKNKNIMTLLGECESWDDVVKHRVLGPRVLRSYSSVKQAYYDLKGSSKLPPLESRLKEYISLKQKDCATPIEAYTRDELKSKEGEVFWLSKYLS